MFLHLLKFNRTLSIATREDIVNIYDVDYHKYYELIETFPR